MFEDQLVQKLRLVPNDGRHFVVAVSGGADSVCLLRSMADLRKKFQFSLSALHVNFGLRGKESDGDEAFVLRLCGRLKVEVERRRFKVSKDSRVQESCRDLRHHAYLSLNENAEILEAHH